MRETQKATRRRMREADAGIFPWRSVFVGEMLDIGAGDDPLPMEGVAAFDRPWDANDLTKYYAPNYWDTLHSSQCVEHLFDAHKSIATWITVLRKGGHLVFTVPEAILYGDLLWKAGPMLNADHKATFSMWLKGSPAPKHYLVPEWVKTLEKELPVKCLLCRLVDDGYDYSVMFTKDQTYDARSNVECFCEVVLLKL